jgi:pectinesterase
MKNILLASLFASLLFCGCSKKKSPLYQVVVALDGSGDYTSVQAAVDAALEYLEAPRVIFIKNGSYKEQVLIPETKPYIHLIGEDKEKTIIHHKLNVGAKPDENMSEKEQLYWKYSVHNSLSEMYQCEGSVVRINGSHFYTENISYVNNWGVETQEGQKVLTISTQADCTAYYNCIFRSFQHTWLTSIRNDSNRLYAKDCWIKGSIDYIFGVGDALWENCTLYNVQSKLFIVVPSHETSQYGYVFRNCIVDGNKLATDGTQKSGCPWHHSLRAVYIHTTMNISIAPEGWTNMAAIPALFAEYDSRDAVGNLLDLSQRRTEYKGRDNYPPHGSCRATITKEEADQYVYENIILRGDGWDPRAIIEEKNKKKYFLES